MAIKWREPLGKPECPYCYRWVLPLGPLGSLRLHHWLASDDLRAYHDHPSHFATLVLRGGYWDETKGGAEWLGWGRCGYGALRIPTRWGWRVPRAGPSYGSVHPSESGASGRGLADGRNFAGSVIPSISMSTDYTRVRWSSNEESSESPPRVVQ
jgi:hypothetical protein